jgi:hypothetical protein
MCLLTSKSSNVQPDPFGKYIRKGYAVMPHAISQRLNPNVKAKMVRDDSVSAMLLTKRHVADLNKNDIRPSTCQP